MGSMGFLVDLPIPNKKPAKAPNECLLNYDSGNGITFEDGSHNILVIGTTGSGKTASVVLPALYRLIQTGHPGVIADIKGNLRRQARALAQKCGRGHDLIEYGSSPSATPLNLLKDKNMAAVRDLLEIFTMEHFQGASNNKDFHMKGVHKAGDCVQLLRYLAALDPAFEPNLTMLGHMLTDYTLCSGAFELFKKAVYDADNAEHRRFLQLVETDEHHILSYNPKKAQEDRRGNYLEQITFNMMGTRTALKNFLDTPGLARGFAAHGADGIDLRGLLEQNKIILLRFGPDTGPLGASLSRIMIQEYYKAVYDTGLDRPEGAYTFACLDEFQEFADLGRGRFSDANFIAQAREFGAIFLSSTQSMSALANRGNSPAAINAFVSNCNARVIFYSDDPTTQNMAAQYDDIRLNELRSGEAFVVQYDAKERNHSFGVETLQKAYRATDDILRQAAHSGGQEDAATVEEEAAPPLYELLERAKARYESEKKIRYRNAALNPFMEDSSSERSDDEQEVMERHMRQELKSEEEQEGVAKLRRSFPQYFPVDGKVDLVVPAGWLESVENAFLAFSESHLELTISAMGINNGTLVVSAKKNEAAGFLDIKRRSGEWYMNVLLSITGKLCILCGSMMIQTQAKRRKKRIMAGDEESENRICAECLGKYSLEPKAAMETPKALKG